MRVEIFLLWSFGREKVKHNKNVIFDEILDRRWQTMRLWIRPLANGQRRGAGHSDLTWVIMMHLISLFNDDIFAFSLEL
jgi:hypothetical protein